jgi:serine/threonine protein kinase
VSVSSGGLKVVIPEPVGFPRRFGSRYVLLKELGHGGMGKVFMASSGQAGLERISALKIINDLQAGRDADEMSQRFLDEAKVVTKLSHENLVFVFDFGIVKRQGYLAMEYVQGKTLTEVWNRCALRAVPFPIGVSLFFIGELTAGLGYAHGLQGLNLVHRDVSPSNLMISYTGGLKLIDFGLAKWKSKVSQTAAGINWGKLSYMSPEQQQGKPIDRRSDLYSAGVILWELLTGRQLFATEQARKQLADITPPSKINGHVSAELDALVLKALAPDPAQRFETGEEMSRAVSSLIPRDAGKLRVAEFMRDLFDSDIRAEAAERAELVSRAASAPVPVAEVLETSASGPIDAGDRIVKTILADRYYVRRLIGEGAMGRVYEGHHTGVGKRVAIKIPRNSDRRKSELLQRFRMEANASSQIGHPNIADVTDCGATPAGDFFFVMEFIDGIDLSKLVHREGPLPLERSILISIQICRGLEAAHKVGIIHRDLKPSNIMLMREREEDFVKVLDFGVAKFLRADAGPQGTPPPELTRSDAAVGTPRYMAPEQITTGAEVDFRTDIYGLGGVMFFMLSGGHAPVEGDSVEAVWRNKIQQDPQPVRHWRSDMPKELESIVMRCLARDPAARPPSMEKLKQELVAALEHVRAAESGVALRAPSVTAMVPDTRRRERRILAFAAAAGIAAVSGGAWAWRWRAPSERAPATAIDTPEAHGGRNAPTVAPPPAEPPAAMAPVAATQPRPVKAAPKVTKPATGTSDVSFRASKPLARTALSLAPPKPAPAPPQLSMRPSPPAAPRPPGPLAPLHGRTSAISSEYPPPPPTTTGEAEALLANAEELFQRGKFALAVLVAKKAVNHGSRLRGQLLLGKIQYRMSLFEEALAAYEQALSVDPENATAKRGREQARAALGR